MKKNQQRIRLLQQRQKENDSKETDLHPGETESASEQPEENSRGIDHWWLFRNHCRTGQGFCGIF